LLIFLGIDESQYSIETSDCRSAILSKPVPFTEFIDDVRLRLPSLLELFVFKNCVEISGVSDVNIRLFEDIDVRILFDDGIIVGTYIDCRRHIVLRRRENEAARRFNSNCEHTTLSNVIEFFPFADEFDIIVFLR